MENAITGSIAIQATFLWSYRTDGHQKPYNTLALGNFGFPNSFINMLYKYLESFFHDGNKSFSQPLLTSLHDLQFGEPPP